MKDFQQVSMPSFGMELMTTMKELPVESISTGWIQGTILQLRNDSYEMM